MDPAIIARQNGGEISDGKPKIPEGFVFDPTKYEQDTGNLAVYVCGFDDVRILPYKVQALGDEDVRIQMKAIGICGSDIHYLKHLRNSRVALKEPMVLGHESAGVIIETGKLVKNLVVGDRVALEPGIPCYRCSFCKQGSNNLCREVKFFGSPPVHGSLAQQELNEEAQAMQIAMEALIDVTFDCVGTTKTMTTALNITRSGGKVCLVGMLHDKMTLPLTAAAAREVDVLGIFRHRNTYKLCIDLLQSKRIDIQKLITHRFGFSQDEVIKGFKVSAAGGSAIKVMFSL